VFTTLVCLRIQQVRHAEAVNTNLTNQLIRGNFTVIPQDEVLMDLWIAGLLVLGSSKTIDGDFCIIHIAHQEEPKNPIYNLTRLCKIFSFTEH
jgi:hypothetical protein